MAWIHPEQSKSNHAIGVALNDTACRVLKKQIGNHHKWVFVYKEESSTKPGGMYPRRGLCQPGNNADSSV
ncbi:hypothetical protein JNA59_10890 [Salmonella enterica subsp. enterica serovar Typhimurium]|nr:hypothetical protein [Salmonella enterica subsp. enterica serovar Typhimurium]